MRITKVTTKTGDSGETGLGNGERVSKNSLRIKAMGAIDKLNSVIGWTRVRSSDTFDRLLEEVQQDLFNIGGELAIPDVEMNILGESRIEWLDNHTEKLNALLPPLDEFILPGGSEFAGRAHIARSECREAEIKIIALSEDEYIPDLHKQYLNRLSDLLFIISRVAKMDNDQKEVAWDYK